MQLNGSSDIHVATTENNKLAVDNFTLPGNRAVNSVLHTMHVTQVRCHQPAKDFVERKRSDGKTAKESRRADKRQLEIPSSVECGTTVNDRRTRQELISKRRPKSSPRQGASSR